MRMLAVRHTRKLTSALSLCLLLGGSVPSQAEPIERARDLTMAGDHAKARAIARTLSGEDALRLVVATSCQLGDRSSAIRAHRQLSGKNRALAQRFCALRGITLKSEARRNWQRASWAGIATTVAATAAFALLARRVSSLEDRKTALMARHPNEPSLHGADVCARATRNGYSDLASVCGEGEATSTAANILLGISAVSAAVTGYLIYRGYIRSERSLPTVALAPAIGSRAGHVLMRIVF